jgi:glycosyltransferase involved in cell wall biosynthesis
MADRTKVFFLSTSLKIGGTEKFLLTLAEHLRDRYDIRIGYLKDSGAVGELLQQKGFAVRRYGSPLALFTALKQENIEILHTFLYRGNVLGRLCGRLAGVPVIVSTQQSIDAWKGPFWGMVDRVSARWCDLIIANSAAAKTALVDDVSIPAAKIQIIYNGLDPAAVAVTGTKEAIRTTLGLPPDAPVIVTVARLHTEKGVDYLPAIAAKTPGTHFLLVGDGPEKERLARLIDQTPGLAGRLHLLGWRIDIPRLLKAADIFLLPSREESFPQAVLEAMALGLPTVAADVGGVRELVEEEITGRLVPAGDCDAFATALRSLLHDSTAARRMGQAALQKAGALTEDKMVAAVATAYRTLQEKKNPPPADQQRMKVS